MRKRERLYLNWERECERDDQSLVKEEEMIEEEVLVAIDLTTSDLQEMRTLNLNTKIHLK